MSDRRVTSSSINQPALGVSFPMRLVVGLFTACLLTVGLSLAPLAWGAELFNPQPDTREAQLVQRLEDPQLQAYLRTAAAAELIHIDTAAGARAIRTRLTAGVDPAVQRAILVAIADHPNPPRELSAWLVELLTTIDASLIPELAAALGRFDDHQLVRDLTQWAQSDQTPDLQRRSCVHTLGYHRTQGSARVLIALIEPQQPEPLRQAAFAALANLWGSDEFGQDVTGWKQWWQEYQRLTPARWDAMLLSRFSHKAQAISRRSRQAIDRLLDAQRQLVRVTPPQDRQSLLTAMLQDPLEPIRQLGVELLDQRSRSGEGMDPALRQTLLERLDDPSAEVRLAAARLLRNLRDEAGSRQRTAQAVARKLSDMQETSTPVLRTYLLILTDTPVSAAVDRQIELLRNAELREDAAGAIAAAIDQGMVGQEDRALLHRIFARLAAGEQPPEPKLIELLGRVGDEDDWKRIASWLEGQEDRIRIAAAKTWAQSDQPLALLAEYVNVPVLQPVIIEAAYRRGKSPAMLEALITNRPQQEQLAQAWQAALVAMAGRIEPAQALKADRLMLERGEPIALRVAFIGAAASALDNRETPRDQDLALHASVWLHYARLLLQTGSAESAWGQLTRLDAHQEKLSTRQQRQLAQLRLEVLAAAGDLDRAMMQSDQILTMIGELPAEERISTAGPVLGIYFNWTDRSIATRQFDQAQRILLYLRSQMSQLMAQNHQQRLASLEQSVLAARTPATPPVNTSSTTPPAETAAGVGQSPAGTAPAGGTPASPSTTPAPPSPATPPPATLPAAPILPAEADAPQPSPASTEDLSLQNVNGL